MRMGKVRILLTGAGAPGCPSIINSLRNNGERELYIVGVDMNSMATCRSKVDSFYMVPSAEDPLFVDRLVEICKKEKIQVLISIVTKELELIAKNRERFIGIGTAVSTMDYELLHIANNKGLLLSMMKDKGIVTPDFLVVNNCDELIKAIKDLGYPEEPVVVKPTFGNGSRGTRILDANKSRYNLFFEEKPNSQYITLEELINVISEKSKIPEMMVMEYLPNEDVCVDVLADHGKMLYVSCRQGVVISSIMVSSIIKFNHEAVKLAEEITREFCFDGIIGFDMKLDKNGRAQLMEINPRLPAGIVCSVVAGVNFPYLMVKQLLGEDLPNCCVKEGYMMQLRNEEVLYNPDGTLVDWNTK